MLLQVLALPRVLDEVPWGCPALQAFLFGTSGAPPAALVPQPASRALPPLPATVEESPSAVSSPKPSSAMLAQQQLLHRSAAVLAFLRGGVAPGGCPLLGLRDVSVPSACPVAHCARHPAHGIPHATSMPSPHAHKRVHGDASTRSRMPASSRTCARIPCSHAVGQPSAPCPSPPSSCCCWLLWVIRCVAWSDRCRGSRRRHHRGAAAAVQNPECGRWACAGAASAPRNGRPCVGPFGTCTAVWVGAKGQRCAMDSAHHTAAPCPCAAPVPCDRQ
jgi:hypothetical protein